MDSRLRGNDDLQGLRRLRRDCPGFCRVVGFRTAWSSALLAPRAVALAVNSTLPLASAVLPGGPGSATSSRVVDGEGICPGLHRGRYPQSVQLCAFFQKCRVSGSDLFFNRVEGPAYVGATDGGPHFGAVHGYAPFEAGDSPEVRVSVRDLTDDARCITETVERCRREKFSISRLFPIISAHFCRGRFRC